MKRWNMAAIVVGAFIAGEMDPAGFVFWKIAEWQLPKYKRVSLQKPSPFQTITSDRYVGESENEFAVDDTKPRAPVHTLVVPKERIPTLLEASPELLGEMLELAKKNVQEGYCRGRLPYGHQHQPQGSADRLPSAYPCPGRATDALAARLEY